MRSIKDECLGMMIFFGEGHLRRAIDEYLEHYHSERNHQGIGNELIEGRPTSDLGDVRSVERLGGMIRYYHRAA